MGVNSKKKGNRFELDIAKRFTVLFEAEFRRTPNSGAYTGGKNRAGATGLREDAQEILSGDIIGPQGFPYLIECKSYADKPGFHLLLQGGDATFNKWVTQNEGDSEFVNKNFLLLFKINRKGEFAVINPDDEFLPDIETIDCPYMMYGKYMIISLENLIRVWKIDFIKEQLT